MDWFGQLSLVVWVGLGLWGWKILFFEKMPRTKFIYRFAAVFFFVVALVMGAFFLFGVLFTPTVRYCPSCKTQIPVVPKGTSICPYCRSPL